MGQEEVFLQLNHYYYCSTNENNDLSHLTMSNKHKLYFNALYIADDCMYNYLFFSKTALVPSKIR